MHFFAILTLSSAFALATAQNTTHGKIVVCSTLQKTITATESDFQINSVDFNLCTHFIVTIDQLYIEDDESDKRREIEFEQMDKLRTVYPHLKFIFSINVVDLFENFCTADGDSNQIKGLFDEFTSNLKKHFDGLDLYFTDLEKSFEEIVKISTKTDNFTEFLKNLQYRFEAKNLLLTTSITATAEYFNIHSEFSKYVDYFDLLHLMQISIASDTDGLRIESLEYAKNELQSATVHQKVDKLIDWGVPASKIVLSINFGGAVSVALSKKNLSTAKVVGFIGYNSICGEYKLSDWKRSYDNETDLSELLMDNKADRQVYLVLYGASRTVANYVRFMVKRKLAGVWAFTIDKDDFKGQCKIDNDTFDDFNDVDGVIFNIPQRNETKFPLLRTINESIFVALDEENQLALASKGTASIIIRNSKFIKLSIIIILIGFVYL